ncbi:hypothetical protein ACL9RL_07370 [Plantibacter sp. Mn2098]|uniref:hypothetical protein n=1 Tax=Plantibacter sp. Mn2098 TaxID=3395266 RepID=UPI003BCB789E
MTDAPQQPTQTVTDATDAFNLDERVFDMVSSTASVVNPEAPTRFLYREERGVIWGDYTGDTVTTGRFCGTRVGNRIDVSFVHCSLAGETTRGSATSMLSHAEDGALLLTEDFVFPDGVAHVSVCREVRG